MLDLNSKIRSVEVDEIQGLGYGLSDDQFDLATDLAEERDRLQMVCRHLAKGDRTPLDRALVDWALGDPSVDSKQVLARVANCYSEEGGSVDSFLTEQEIDALQKSKLHRETPFLIRSVSTGFFSVSRHYGGAKLNGNQYTYMQETDELVRDDVLRWVSKARCAAEKQKREIERVEADAAIQRPLFDLGLDIEGK